MKKVLVTGADGFIGSHLTESLLEKGYDVKAFAYYNSFNTWGWLDSLPADKLKEIEVFTGDIRDPNGVREAMKGVDGVFHLAALIAIPFSYHSPDSYVDTNVKGTLNVLQAARQLETQRVLVTSTSEVYGTAQYVPIDEKHPLPGAVPLFRYKNRRRPLSGKLLPQLWPSSVYCAPLQHLWPPAVGKGSDSHDYHPAAGRKRGNPVRFPDAYQGF